MTLKKTTGKIPEHILETLVDGAIVEVVGEGRYCISKKDFITFVNTSTEALPEGIAHFNKGIAEETMLYLKLIACEHWTLTALEDSKDKICIQCSAIIKDDGTIFTPFETRELKKKFVGIDAYD